MNISFLNFSTGLSIQNIDYAWLSLKSYTEDNYKGDSKLNWSHPIQNSSYNNIDELVDLVLSQDPHILACSLYVWNSKLTDEVVERVKLQRPDIFVVYGGPHTLYKSDPDYFKNHWYIDVVCEPDGYGEPFINELLYQLETDKDLDKVPYAIWPYDGSYKKSSIIFNKKKFEWPRKIFERNADYLSYLKSTGDIVHIMLETARGCPYGCVYCEWSGGINSKVVFKPYDYIIEDLDYLYSTIKPHGIGIIDANFGILDRDIDITKHIVSKKIQFGYPNLVNIYGPSKVKKDNVYEILELIRLANISTDYKLSVQDFDEKILNNINRPKGEGWEKELIRYTALTNDHDTTIGKRVELILGLPGSTISNYYKGLDVMLKYNIYAPRYEWFLLPTSPASEKAYVEKFKIKTLKAIAVSLLSYSGENDIISFDQKQNGPLIHTSKLQDELDIVCETYSYTAEEYVEMFAMNRIINVFEQEKYLSDISTYLNDHLNMC